MSDVKYAAAKELIQQKQYTAARAILETLDEPKAAGWLAQLDRIAPVAPPIQPPPTRPSRLPWFIAIAALLLAATGWIVALRPMLPASIGASADIQRLVDAYCAYPMHFERGCDPSTLNDPATNELIQRCYAASGQGQDVRLFINCMLAAGMFNSVTPDPNATPLVIQWNATPPENMTSIKDLLSP